MDTARTISLSAAAMLVMTAYAPASPLSFVNVAAPDINCGFNSTCTVTVT